MEIILFLFICFFKYILTKIEVITDFEPIIEKINENSMIQMSLKISLNQQRF
jgi:hypothetical protein